MNYSDALRSIFTAELFVHFELVAIRLNQQSPWMGRYLASGEVAFIGEAKVLHNIDASEFARRAKKETIRTPKGDVPMGLSSFDRVLVFRTQDQVRVYGRRYDHAGGRLITKAGGESDRRDDEQ